MYVDRSSPANADQAHAGNNLSTACKVAEQIPAMQGAPSSLYLSCHTAANAVGAPVLRYTAGKLTIKGLVQRDSESDPEHKGDGEPITRAIGVGGALLDHLVARP